MAHAYTPGLQVSERAVIRKHRRLPVPGEVLAKEGQEVRAEEVVARALLPGSVTMVNVARELNVQPEEVPRFMLKREGDEVQAGEVIAELRAFFGLFHSIARSPIDGTIESISEVTGQVAIRGRPTPVDVRAYVDGTVVEVLPNEGVVVSTTCAYVQGIFGIGGEGWGELHVAVDGPGDTLEAGAIDEGAAGKVLVGGAFVTLEALQAAREAGAVAVVVGGMDDRDLDRLLGYPIGVAITGHEKVGLTVILTEGFGPIPMAERTFNLLKARHGRRASVNGATQIRAGVVRPEVIIPEPGGEPFDYRPPEGRIEVGSPVRLIREPYFGRLGTVVELPPEPEVIETEARVRILRVKLDDGAVVTVPRANVELIEQ